MTVRFLQAGLQQSVGLPDFFGSVQSFNTTKSMNKPLAIHKLHLCTGFALIIANIIHKKHSATILGVIQSGLNIQFG